LRTDAASQIFRYQGIQDFTVLTSSSISGTGAGQFFTLGGISASTLLAQVFDQYRITRIQVYITPPFTQIVETAPDNAMYCSAVDLDNATAPTTIAATQCKPGAFTTNIVGAHYHSWVPKIAMSVYTGAFGGFADAPDGVWCDCANTNVQYYGLKLFVDTTQVNNLFFRATVVFDIEFRGISVA
jgi:hypothetical protein